ncbi:protein-glutamate methylesterase/protein-glutamine glutaminase [Paenibacillus tianjinensis]|uniref:Protein-glutamate methylesterase/protein-glutamine glutaminase n=1 Tax=Paenibacillus tianjinensis TaxID=2810347 RepID=A0ABX7LM70_9BACL|nr:chemotaxis response regulator protein-glutamate methylesterase [Paenibacillus tianjinensis]QSF46967.1 chemotaxis response regulator protein-glutamate methylesterase [Paenibacillus tianjinensis]
MKNTRSIRVLVVDDSLLFREVISRGISSDPLIEVAARAGDPFEARDELLRVRPDVMLCDVQMPKMNGIEFIRRLLPQYAIPVIVVSGVTETVFEAMNAGAVDFEAKPDMNSPGSVQHFLEQLIVKIKNAAHAKILAPVQPAMTIGTSAWPVNGTKGSALTLKERLIVIGASTGGTEAIASVINALPPDMPGIIVVQHIPPVFSRMFSERLNLSSALTVKEAEDGDLVTPGKVFVAPGDKQVSVQRIGGQYRLECASGAKVNGHCPSVDVLFESAAKAAGAQVIGVLLTGMGYDGAKGLLALRRKGAHTIGQDEATSVVYGMPKAAYELGAVEKQAALPAIPRLLLSMLQ